MRQLQDKDNARHIAIPMFGHCHVPCRGWHEHKTNMDICSVLTCLAVPHKLGWANVQHVGLYIWNAILRTAASITSCDSQRFSSMLLGCICPKPVTSVNNFFNSGARDDWWHSQLSNTVHSLWTLRITFPSSMVWVGSLELLPSVCPPLPSSSSTQPPSSSAWRPAVLTADEGDCSPPGMNRGTDDHWVRKNFTSKEGSLRSKHTESLRQCH